MRILINSYQFYVLKGVSSGVRSAQATRQTEPVDMVNLLDRRLLAAVGLKHCSGRQWPKDVNFNGYTLG